jgi:hypothetical protein
MEALVAALGDFKVIIGAITFLVGIVIWIYRLRLDTNVNTKAIEDLKDTNVKVIKDLRADMVKKDEEIDQKIEILRLSIKEELKEIKDDFKEDFKAYKDKDGERASRIFDKLDEIGKEIVIIKVEQAKRGSN